MIEVARQTSRRSPLIEQIVCLWRSATGTTPLTIAFDMWHMQPAHPDVQRRLGANISMDEFYALFPNANCWTSDTTYVWLIVAMRYELLRASSRLAGEPEVIFVDEEGP